jgi:hypothetical protein
MTPPTPDEILACFGPGRQEVGGEHQVDQKQFGRSANMAPKRCKTLASVKMTQKGWNDLASGECYDKVDSK